MKKKEWPRRDAFACALLALCVSLAAACIVGCSRVPQIAIEGQEARLSPVLLGVCSVFMRIENSGNGDDTLLGARADIPGSVTELHDVRAGKMERKEKIPIPAKSMVELRPGGLHIMILKMPRDVSVGGNVALRLMFEKSGERIVPVTIGK